MIREIRFGDFVRETNLKQQCISYNELTPEPEIDSEGREIPFRPEKIQLRPIDVQRLLTPYVSTRF